MNAFTTHEQTVFYVRVPDVQLEPAFEVLADVLWRPAFRADDVESERQVILEEIGMRDDTPDDLVHDLFAGAIFPDHPLGREVLGSDDIDHGDGARRHRRVPRARTTSRRTSSSRPPATSPTSACSTSSTARFPSTDGRPPAATTARRRRAASPSSC